MSFNKNLKSVGSPLQPTRPQRLSVAMASAATYPPATPERSNGGRGNLQPSRGFTAVEFLIALSILAILTAIIFTSMSAFRGGKALQIVSEDILSLLDEARGNTLSAKDSYAYGTHFESSRIVLFRGSVYSSSDPNNKTVLIDGAVEISNISLVGGGQDALFQRLTGKTSQSGTITIRLKSDNSKTKTILIETSGVASSN